MMWCERDLRERLPLEHHRESDEGAVVTSNPQSIERLRSIGRTAAGSLTTETGIVWHPANELLWAADEINLLRAALERIVRIDDKHGQPGQKPVAWTLHECGKIAREALRGEIEAEKHDG